MIAAWRRLIRFGFSLLYNQFAFSYDLVSRAVSLGAWRCWQRAALKHLGVEPGARVLEIAFGTGNLHADLHALGYDVVGLDLSPAMLRIAGRKLARQGIQPKFARGMAQRLPFASASFEAVVTTFPAEFIAAPDTLREVNRVLKPGGRFVVVPYAVFSRRGLAEASLEWIYRLTGQRAAGGEPIGLAAFFTSYGFEAEAVQEQCPRSVATVIVARKRA